jgi:transcriptional regulator
VYTPPFNRHDDDTALRGFVAEVRAGWLVTSRPGAAPAATFLPVLWHGDTVVAHLARANAHWREIEDDLELQRGPPHRDGAGAPRAGVAA